MLEDLPRHAGYVIAAYAVVIVAIGGLVAWIAYGRRTQQRMLDQLERGGAGRADLSNEGSRHE